MRSDYAGLVKRLLATVGKDAMDGRRYLCLINPDGPAAAEAIAALSRAPETIDQRQSAAPSSLFDPLPDASGYRGKDGPNHG